MARLDFPAMLRAKADEISKDHRNNAHVQATLIHLAEVFEEYEQQSEDEPDAELAEQAAAPGRDSSGRFVAGHPATQPAAAAPLLEDEDGDPKEDETL